MGFSVMDFPEASRDALMKGLERMVAARLDKAAGGTAASTSASGSGRPRFGGNSAVRPTAYYSTSSSGSSNANRSGSGIRWRSSGSKDSGIDNGTSATAAGEGNGGNSDAVTTEK
jgi:hypothetical protein